MDLKRFDGRVAIVTGGGSEGGLGREYVRLLGARGASVVVNDIGVAPDGRGDSEPAAESAAAEVVANGGIAVADTNSVATEEGAQAVVETAIREFGRVDVLINNAGIAVFAAFDEISSADVERLIGVHLMGHIWMCRAAWPHMKRAGYGRIVNITSDAHMGRRRLSVYGAAKGGILSLSQGLAVEGAASGISVNVVGPGAGTRAVTHWFGESDWQQRYVNDLSPALVAPAVVALAHEDCPFTGRYVRSVGNHVATRFLSETTGYDSPGEQHTVEQISANWDRIEARDGATEVGVSNLSAADLVEAHSDHVPNEYRPETRG